MPIRTALWRVCGNPQQLAESALPKEQTLEDMIVGAPGLVSEEWMLIGRQEDTGHGGRIDLLAIRIWVKVPNTGFVGVGRVTGVMQSAADFRITDPNGNSVSILDVAKGGSYHRELLSNKDQCEYFVPVKWLQTVPVQQAIWEVGLFGNQNTVCQPTTPEVAFDR